MTLCPTEEDFVRSTDILRGTCGAQEWSLILVGLLQFSPICVIAPYSYISHWCSIIFTYWWRRYITQLKTPWDSYIYFSSSKSIASNFNLIFFSYSNLLFSSSFHVNIYYNTLNLTVITILSNITCTLYTLTAVYVFCLAQCSRWDFGILVGFIECDQVFVGYTRIFILFPLSFCLWSSVNCVRNQMVYLLNHYNCLPIDVITSTPQ
jgi:hypothetical protein